MSIFRELFFEIALNFVPGSVKKKKQKIKKSVQSKSIYRGGRGHGTQAPHDQNDSIRVIS